MNGQFRARGPYARLVAATDGSGPGGLALIGAAQLAKRTGAELYVFHAAGEIGGEAAVARQVADLAGVGYKLEIRNLIAGTPMSASQLISEFVDELGDNVVVVVGTHGRSGFGAALLGSTTAELVSRAGRATVVYGTHAKPPTDIDRVVACVDGSDFSELCVEEGALWSLALRVPLWIVQVVPPDLPSYVTAFESTFVQNLSKQLESSGSAAVEWEVLHAKSPAQAILDSFGEDPATMLVMATHGRVGFKRVIMGSVALEVVRRARGPVALIQPKDPATGDS